MLNITSIDEFDVPIHLTICGNRCIEPHTKIIEADRNEIAKRVSEWYVTRRTSGTDNNNTVTIKQIVDGYKEEKFSVKAYFSIDCEVTGFGDTFTYKTCADRSSSSKTEEIRNGVFKCKRCGTTSSLSNTESTVLFTLRTILA
uniref:Uncharacterized protein n=1 Tax=Strongyloides venezuelensis TaxID=75913 RepID=A0A0K0FW26_STRVS